MLLPVLQSAGAVQGNAPFYILAEEIGNPAHAAIVSSGSVPDLISAFIHYDDFFASFDGTNSTARLNYLGVDDALTIHYVGSAFTAVLRSSVTDLDRVFVGASSADLYDQLEEFITTQGAGEWAKILDAIGRRSKAGMNDGNPNAATAVQANSSFMTALDTIDELVAMGGAGTAREGFNDIGFGLNGGKFKVTLPDGRTLRGSNSNIEIPYRVRFSDSVSLALVLPLGMTDVGGGKSYHAGISAALPMVVVRMQPETRLAWKLVPAAGVLARGSVDFANGVALYHLGICSSLTYRYNKRTYFTLGTHLSAYESFRVEFDDVSIDPGVSQQILKNGIRLTRLMGADNRWVAQGMYVHTVFLKDAAVDTYHTLGAGLSYRVGRRVTIGINGNYDFASGYDLWNVGIGSVWRF